MNEIKKPKYYLLQVDSCPYCGSFPAEQISVVEYEEFKEKFESPWHECTSSSSIFGGGPCCDSRGHTITPVY